MPTAALDLAARLGTALRQLRQPSVLAAMAPVLGLAYVVGGWEALAVAALAGPLPFALAQPPGGRGVGGRGEERDGLTGLGLRAGLVAALDRALVAGGRTGRSTCALLIEIDRFKLLEERHDRATVERVLAATATRLDAVLRGQDYPARLDGPTFAVALGAARRLDLDAAVELAGRIQKALGEPLAVGGASLHLSASVGFALASRMREPTGEALLQAATLALLDAQRGGPGAIRAYSDAMRARADARNDLAEEVAAALERGDVRAFFQPQVSIRTGAITGFEALARWHHPERGLLPPGEFLPAIEQAGLMDRLGEAMLACALRALREWEAAGFHVPRVGVNFSNDELCDPRLVDRVGWDLDRFELSPDRLAVEVLETVVAARGDDMVVRNLAGLARIGCRLDLDDFGTGHASITNIRRFSIERIKIDRSFVTGIDEDPEQQKMVGAILTMAERLGLDTLAEGVETAAEQAMLAKLGCGHAQGYGIARPMPINETIPWMRAWEARQAGGGRQLKVV